MSISMKLNGAKELSEKLKKHLAKMTDEMGADYYKALRDYTPYRDGTAQAGWRLKKNKRGSIIKNNVPYIQPLEDGWSKQFSGQGMTKPAKKRIEDNIQRGKYKMNKKRK